MNAQQITQIAQHLNISPNQVKEVQEWAYVYFVKFTKGSPRFVSKKVQLMAQVKVSEKTRSRYFQGFVFDRIPVRDAGNGLQSTWVLGVCSSFEFKDELKAFTKAHGGTWESTEKYWYVPLSGSTVKELLPQLWAMVELAVDEIGHCLPEYLELTVEADLGKHNEVVMGWLARKARMSMLSVVPTPAPPTPIRSDLPTDDLFLTPAQLRKDAEEYEEARLMAWQGEV